MLMQVHDELVFECKEENADFMSKEIIAVMMDPFLTKHLEVILEVDGGPGENWGEAK